ncbi:receptor-type tyrosine-protein phosphatase beta isoform X5 [Oncorhynchus kisutch]|uniref:receptor-type tyrosine-protein phosphatase beta isoform X5 n=1 Tax=Oncorhynchus kisutch TaxID=8019 RepID=UPI0012DD4F73|nr:receptor-type tyrosine-protein phosphatase beta isoform X5 [Oncorhynchus kisutch]
MSRMSCFGVLLRASIVLYLFLKCSEAQCTPCTNFKGVVTHIDSTAQVDSNCSLSTGNASVPSNLTTVNVLNKNQNFNCCCTTMPEVIMNLTASEITTSSVFLSWTEPFGNRSFFRVEWTDGKTNGSQNTPETSFNVTALTPGVQYLFTVTAVAGDNTTVGQSKTVSKYTKPAIIRNLMSIEITTASVFLSWTEPFGNRSFFRIEWTDGKTNGSQNTPETSFNVTALTPGVQYLFTVTAVAGDNTTVGQSKTVSKYTKPAIIRNLMSIEITTASVFLSWTEPFGNRSFFRIEWTDGKTNGSQNTPETSFNVTALTPGVQYLFTVTAVAGDNTTVGQSKTVSKYTKPAIIRNLMSIEITTASVFLSWTEPFGNRSFFRIEWTDGKTNGSQNTPETSFNVTALTPGVQYLFTVTAVAGDNTTVGQSKTVSKYTKPAVIRNLTVTEITTASVSLSWIEPLGNSSFYRVEWTDGSRDMNTTTNVTAFNVTELTAGVKYTFKVTAVAGDNITKGKAQEKALFTKPEVIRNLSVSEITTSSVSLSWIEPLGNRSFYRVEWTDGSRDMNTTTIETAFNVTELTAGVKYTFRVTAVAGDEMTEGKNISVSLFTKPAVIRNLTVTEITTASVSLSWIEPLGNSSFYRVEWTDGSRDMNTTTNVTAFNVTELTAGVKYTFKVTAVAGDNITKGKAQEKALFTKPAVIRNLTVTEITTASVSLSWIEPLGNSSFYRVEWTDGSRDMNTTTNVTAFNVTELTAGVKYTFKVTAVAGDNITKGKAQEKALFTKPEVIRNLSVSEITTSSVSLSWIEPLGNRSFYRVEWTDGSRDMNTTTIETAFNVTELTAGVKYTFRVTAVAGDEMTEGKNISVSLFTKPAVIRNLTVTEITTASVSLSWIEPLGNSSFYRVEWTDGSRDMNTTTNVTAFNVTELTAGVKYTFKVTAVAGDNITKGKAQEKALFTKPEVIRNLSVSEITTSSVSLSWIEPLGNRSFYRVEWTDGSRDMNTTTIETAFNVTELTAGVKYTFRVTAVAGDEMTEGKNISVSLFTKPAVIRNLTVTEITTASVSLSWIEPLGNSSFYRVEWTDGSRDMNTTTNVTAFNVTELTAGVKYTFKVTAVAGDNITKGKAQEKALFTKPEVIRNLSVSEITTSSVSLSWIEPLGNRSFYRVEWTDGSRDMNTTTIETAFNVTELTAGVKYTFRVTAVAGDEMTEGKNISVSLFTKPAVIRNLTVTEITTASVSLSWIEPLGNSSFYRVEWTDGSRDMNTTTNVTAFNVTELTAGVKYTFKVTAVAGDNITKGKAQEKALFTKPEVIRNLSVSEITTSSVSLSWIEPLGNRSFYRVEWTDGSRDMNTTTIETAFNVTELTAGVKYTFRVTAVAGDEMTEGKNISVSLFTKPAVIRNLTVTEITTASVSLSWIEPLGNSSFYRVEWTDGSRDMNTTTNVTAFNVTELTAGVKYTFKVTAVAGDNITTGKAQEKALFTKPEVIRNLSVSEITTSSVSLSWIEPLGNRSFYRVEWTDGSRDMNTTTIETAFNVTELTAGVKYTFRVTAVAGDEMTEGKNISVSLFTKPAVIRNLTVTEITTSSVSLSWTEPFGNRSFFRVEWTDGITNGSQNTPETSFNVTALTPGVQYLFTVTAVAGDNTTVGQSKTVSKYTKPAVVRNLYVSEITTSSVSLNWTQPEGNSFFYRVKWIGANISQNVPKTFTTITGLTAGMQYIFTVSAVAGDNTTVGEESQIITLTKPAQPVDIVATRRGTSQLNVTWTLHNGTVEYYSVNIFNAALNYTSSNTTQTREASFTGLQPGRVYEVTVTAVAGDFRNQSAQVQLATNPNPPGPLTITERTTSSLVVQWTTPGLMIGAQGISYNISYQLNGTGLGERNLSSSTTSLSSNLTSLSSGTCYTITVKTMGPQNLESTSVYASECTLPKPVVNLTATPLSNSSCKLQWTDPVEVKNYYTYRVQYIKATGPVPKTVSTNFTQVNDLEPGTGYNFTVTTVAATGSEGSPERTFCNTKPNVVSNLTFEGLNTTTIRLSWLKPNDHKPTYSYLVTISKNGSVVEISTMVEMYTFTNLTPGNCYNCSVVTVVQDVKSDSTETIICTKPAVVKNLIAIGTTTNMSVTWYRPMGQVDNYTVTIYKNNVMEDNRTITNNYLSVVFQNLKPGKVYVVKVATNSGPLTEALNVTNATYPNPPGGIMVVDQTTGSINISWARPLDMDLGQYSFSVFHLDRQNLTEHNWTLLKNLQSGTLYNISVVTVGPFDYQSTVVTTANSTRPQSVIRLIEAGITTTNVTLVWFQPESKPGYTFRVEITNQSVTTNTTMKTITGVQSGSNYTTNITITGLQSGSNYTFTVTTLTGDGTMATPVTVSYFTRPFAVSGLVASTVNTTTVNLTWTKPPQYQSGYTYRIQTEGCMSAPTNRTTETGEGDLISELTPGTRCTFSVSVKALNSIEGESVSTSQYTKPESVNMFIYNNGSNSTIVVRWEAPRGNVEHYIVYLNKVLFSDLLNSSIRSTSFLNLSAGRSYTAVVTTISGPFNASSEPGTTATYPNQPGPILILEKTTSSISVEWGEAPLMTNTTFSYLVTYLSTQLNNKTVTLTNTRHTLPSLSSGTPYNISVATVGVLGLQSEKVWSSLVTTRPESVQSLSVVTAEENITLTWNKPVDHKPSYHYYVIWINSGLIISNTTTLMEDLIINQLVPGSLYNFTVTTETADGTKGAPVSNSICTNASPVFNLKCDSPNDPKVILSWTKPKGLNQGFQITAYETNQPPQDQAHYNTSGDCTPACGHTVSDLKHNTDYTLTVTTLGCGSSSTIQKLTCKTGVNAVIGVAVGVTIGVFAILFIITIALVIHWRRQTKKDTSDIQIHSMRAKVSVAVRVEDYEAYYKRQKADSNCGFAEEFEDLKPVGTAQAKTSAMAMENKSKNRYNNVLPYESSRVKLSIHGSPFDDYINSNYIPGYNSRKEFIAAQGPLPVTVNEFWRMIWEKNVQTLVMLTRCNEQGRVKCEKYWPSETKHFENITVTTTSEIPLEDWTIRDFDVKNVRTAETRSVRHFHFTAWPDHGVPETTELLINFRHLVREHMDQYSRHSPTVVHCSAGVGRTGTFIAIDRLIFQIERDSMVDVYGTIHDLRMHRPLMVQTEDQYLFLNQCAIDIIRSRTGTNVDLIYQNTAALTIYENVEPRKDTAKNGYHNT